LNTSLSPVVAVEAPKVLALAVAALVEFCQQLAIQ
jgi:hypothetical protein